MKRFSERIGVVSPSTVIQVDGMSDTLRNSLWNTVYSYCDKGESVYTFYKVSWRELVMDIAKSFRKIPIDLVVSPRDSIIYTEYWYKEWVKDYFYDLEWYIAFDLIEFINNCLSSGADRNVGEDFGFVEKDFNFILERELSGYRFVSGKLVPISNPVETEAISDSIQATARTGLLGANEHIETSLQLFGKRPDPDYRNAIKEAISAVESVAKQLSGSDSQGLDGALTVLSKKIDMHGALKQGFSRLYGYSSDEDGIRHAILDEPNVGFDEAKYMIVSCSAFVNFLISKANSCGLLPKEA